MRIKVKSIFKKLIIFFIWLYSLIMLYLFSSKLIHPNSIIILFTSVVLTYVFWWAIRKYELKSLYLITLVYGLLYVFLIPVFSPIDEAAHFDYINTILFQHHLPLISDKINTAQLSTVSGYAIPGEGTLQYEAVHPPLYYFLASLIIYPIHSYLALSVMVLRIVGLAFLLFTLFFTQKTFSLVAQKFNWKVNQSLFACVSLLLFTNPSIITRMVTVSNESLAVFLFSLLIYLLTQFILNGHSINQIRIISFIIAGLILTKITTVIIVFPLLLVLYLTKKWRYICEFIVCTGVIILPWFIFNLFYYHSLTGTREHVQFVKGIVNPDNNNLGFEYITQKVPYLIYSFWTPQEIKWTGIYELSNLITYFLSGSLILSLLAIIFKIYQVGKERPLDFEIRYYSILLLIVFLSVALLIYGTISQDVDILIGRYLYLTIVPLTLFIYTLIKEVSVKKVPLYFILILFLSTYLTYSGLVYFSNNDHNALRYVMKNINKEIKLDKLSKMQERGLFENKDLGIIPEKLATEWDSASYNEKSSRLSIDKLSSVNDIIKTNDTYYASGPDPYIVWNTDGIIMNSGDMLNIYAQFETNTENQHLVTGQLFWQDGNNGFDETRSYKFNFNNGRAVIPLGFHKDWIEGRQLLSIRLDIDTLEKDGIKIDHLEIRKISKH